MAETDEPTFDMDDIFQLLSETGHLPVETPFALDQQDEPIGIKGSFQFATPTSDANANMSRNPEITFGYGSVAGPSNCPVGEWFANTSSSPVSQLDQHHQFPAQFVETTNNFPASAQQNGYLTDNQRQQQQTMFRNLSPSFTTRSQELFTSDAQQGLEMEWQMISQNWQMEKALNMQNQFPPSQNVTLDHPMKSENGSHHLLQGPPRGCPSITRVQMATSSDWVEYAIQQIQSLKDIYLPEVISLYNRASELRNQTQNPNLVAHCENAMDISQSTHTYLHMSRADIYCDGEEIFSRGMNCLRVSLDRIRKMNFNLMQHASSSSCQLKTAQLLQQRGSVPKCYSTSPSLVRSSLQVGSSSEIENYALPSHHNSSLTGYGQGFYNMPPHSSTGVSQQLYMSDLDKVVASSQNINNFSISPITQNSFMTNFENNNHSNVIKSTEQSMSEQHMHQIMQTSNGNSAMRHFMTFNKSCSYEVPSPQSSSLTEFPEVRTSSLSASKRTLPSTLNPLTPSSKRVDSDKSMLSFEKDISPAQAESQLKDSNQSHGVMDSQELRTCPSDVVCRDQGEPSTDKEDPFKRLTKVVKSMPPKELNPTVRERSGAGNIKDRTMDTVNDSRKCKDQENYKWLCGTSVHAKMKRQMDSSDSRTVMEARASDMMKRSRKQVS